MDYGDRAQLLVALTAELALKRCLVSDLETEIAGLEAVVTPLATLLNRVGTSTDSDRPGPNLPVDGEWTVQFSEAAEAEPVLKFVLPRGSGCSSVSPGPAPAPGQLQASAEPAGPAAPPAEIDRMDRSDLADAVLELMRVVREPLSVRRITERLQERSPQFAIDEDEVRDATVLAQTRDPLLHKATRKSWQYGAAPGSPTELMDPDLPPTDTEADSR